MKGDTADSRLSRYIAQAFSNRLKNLTVGATMKMAEHDADLLDKAIASVIKSRTYTDISSIFLDNLETAQMILEFEPSVPKTHLWFSKAVAAGSEHGVYMHTRWSTTEHDLCFDYPLLPTELDMLTSPNAEGERFALRTWDGIVTPT